MSSIEKASSSPQVLLIPWDPDSPEHIQRLVDQRIACGWKADAVEGWRPLQRSGVMSLQWVTLPPSSPTTPALLHQHTTLSPRESTPLNDTATTFSSHARSPSSSPFLPIGHISLDTINPYSASLANPSLGIYCITTFYISRALHSSGLGRATMDRIEATAAAAPIHARVLTLNTLANDQLLRKDMWTALDALSPHMEVQSWYARRGYVVFGGEERAFRQVDKGGGEWWMKDVWMRKVISQP